MEISNEQGILLLLHQANGNLETVKKLMEEMYDNKEPVPSLQIANYLCQIEITITEILHVDESPNTRRQGVQPQELSGNLPRKEEGEEGLYFETNPN